MRVMEISTKGDPGALEFLPIWHVLGPFQIGTREASWGADPVERYGGISSLDSDAMEWPSSLGINGHVSWSLVNGQTSNGEPLAMIKQTAQSAEAKLLIHFPEIDWDELQAVYGWAAFQWQAWLRGTLIIHGDEKRTIKLLAPGILELDIDGERHFGGDFFHIGKAPLVLRLPTGTHTIALRVIRDTRACGGVGEPSFELGLTAQLVASEVFVDEAAAIFPDMVKGQGYAGQVCSVPIQNLSSQSIEIIEAQGGHYADDQALRLQDGKVVSIAPGQTKALNMDLRQPKRIESTWMHFNLRYRRSDSPQIIESQSFALQTVSRSNAEPYKMTFRHMNGTVSYAILQAPCQSAFETSKGTKTPVLVVLHGAGVEVESTQTRDMLKSVGDIPGWVLVPTGGNAWSADDWHTWGLTDVVSAIDSLPDHLDYVGWNGPEPDIERIYVAGHSNGGQGVWHMLSRMPDRIVAAAPVSGYISIQKYVPYSWWAECDPRITAVIHGSLTNYRHELFVDNFKEIPIQQQHGSGDDNVPVLHSRRMYQLRKENGTLHNAKYSEIPGAGHWYEGIMATPTMKAFYSILQNHQTDRPTLPSKFSIVAPATGEVIGSKYGFTIDRLHNVGQLGRITVEISEQDSDTPCWEIETSNVLQFRIDYTCPRPGRLRINGYDAEGRMPPPDKALWIGLDRVQHRGFMSSEPCEGNSDAEQAIMAASSDYSRKRFNSQYGTINAILRTAADLQIEYTKLETFKIALQISRNLYQYFSANSEIAIHDHAISRKGNSIIVSQGIAGHDGVAWDTAINSNRSIEVRRDGIKLCSSRESERLYPMRPGLGAVYLVPAADQRLNLIVWGVDKRGLELAARFIPGLAGTGLPDFIILGPECAWKGAAGCLAMGFFNHDWSISTSSYIS